MKNLRINFALLVGIIVVGLTIITKAGQLKKTPIGTEQDCFDVQTATGLLINILNAKCETIPINATVTCPGTAFYTFGIFTDLTSHPIVPNPMLSCPGSAKVCCVEVETDPSPCLNMAPQQNQSGIGTVFKYYQVKAIRCTFP